MTQTARVKGAGNYSGKAAALLLLVLGLAFLAGCQGVSAGGNSQAGGLSLAATVDFGNVVAGSNKSLTVAATNTGSAALSITSVSISTQYFAMTAPGLPVTIGAGQTASLSLEFSPNAAGAFNATATIATNASSSPAVVTLAGTGTTAAGGPLTVSPTSESFGSVQVGNTQSTTVTVTNTGANGNLVIGSKGTAARLIPASYHAGNGKARVHSQATADDSSVTISAVGVSGTGFKVSGISTPVTLASGQSTTFTLAFDPTAGGSATGTLTISSDGSNPTLTMPVTGTGVTAGALGADPASLSFGSVQVGTKQSLTEKVTNSGGESVTISGVAANGTGFTVSGITTPVALGSGQSTTFSVSFDPTTAADASGSVTVTSNGTNPTLTIPLTGTGVAAGALTASPASVGFGSVQVGVKQTVTEKVTNSGGESVRISSITASGTGFSVSGITTPETVAAGASATFSVSFDPTTAASATGSVTVTSNASNATLTIPLTGTGVAAGTLTANPTSISFGSVQVGVKQTTSETVTNSGGESVTISSVAASGTGYSVSGITTPVTLTSGQSATFSVSFDPATATGVSGSVTVTSNASNATLTISLSGTGVSPGTLTANPTSLGFGSVQVGNSQTLSQTVTNTGGESVTISAVLASTGFSVSGITTPVTLAAGKSQTFSVTFTPTAAASASGTLTVSSNASNPTLTVGLTGTGTTATGVLAVSPTTLALGNVTVGSSGTASASLNASTASVTVSAVSSSNSQFSVTGLTLPVTIPSGQSAGFTVTFTPTSAAAASGTITFTSNGSPTTTQLGVSGTGVAAQTHTVSLSWTASTSSDISGYNIYRAPYTTACGSFAQINPSLDANTAYTDASVVNGSAYCYAATAVNTSDAESGYSNIVSNVQIPAN